MVKHTKIIKKIGNSIGLIFNKEEQQVNKIKVGDHVNIDMEKV